MPFPFPTTPILDSFNRADGAVGANWTLLGGFANGLNVSSNQVTAAAAGGGAMYWNVATYGGDCEVYVSVPTLPGTAAFFIRLYLRVQNPGSTTARNGYFVEWDWQVGGTTDNWKLFRQDNNANTQLGSTVTSFPNLVAGDKIGLQANGNVLTVWAFHNSAWTPVLTYDTSGDGTKYTTAGNIALQIRDNVIRGDDFGGGTYVAPPYGPGFGAGDGKHPSFFLPHGLPPRPQWPPPLLAAGSVANTVTLTFTQAQQYAQKLATSAIRAFTQATAATFQKAVSRATPVFTQSQTAVAVRAVAKAPIVWGQAQAATLQRSVSRTVSFTQAQTATLQRSVSKAVAFTQAQTATLQRSVGKVFSVAQAQTATAQRAVGKAVVFAQAQAASLQKAVSRTLSTVSQATAVTFVQQKVKLVSITVTQASQATMQRAVSVARSAGETAAGTLRKAVTKTPFTVAQASVAAMSRGFFRSFVAAVSELAQIVLGAVQQTRDVHVQVYAMTTGWQAQPPAAAGWRPRAATTGWARSADTTTGWRALPETASWTIGALTT